MGVPIAQSISKVWLGFGPICQQVSGSPANLRQSGFMNSKAEVGASILLPDKASIAAIKKEKLYIISEQCCEMRTRRQADSESDYGITSNVWRRNAGLAGQSGFPARQKDGGAGKASAISGDGSAISNRADSDAALNCYSKGQRLLVEQCIKSVA